MSTSNESPAPRRAIARLAARGCMVLACSLTCAPHGADAAGPSVMPAGEARQALPADAATPNGSETVGDAGASRTRAASRESAASQATLRCWQGGHLIYEGKGFTALAQAKVAGELKSPTGASWLQIVDLYQGLCLLEVSK